MSEIILQTTALKITNRGGGMMMRRAPGAVPDEHGHIAGVSKTDTGSDYVTFVCPHPKCGHRNKMCTYEMEPYKPANEDVIPFKCRMCRRTVEVGRPRQSTPLIMDPATFGREMANRRKALSERRPVQ